MKLSKAECAELDRRASGIHETAAWLLDVAGTYREKYDARSESWKESDGGAAALNWIECLEDASEQLVDAATQFEDLDRESAT